MFDIIIIGAGPAGISMAVEAINSGINKDKILIIEKTTEHSFTIKKYYPDKKLVTANYKGFEPLCTGVMCIADQTKHETISYLDSAILENNLNVNYNEVVYKIEKQDDGSFIIITDKKKYQSKIIVIAIGILGKPNKPEYKIPPNCSDKVFYDLTTKEIKNSKVLVVGGGDSASEYCQFLVQENNSVTLSYRKNDFIRMNQINQQSIQALEKSGSVIIKYSSNIIELKENSGKVEVLFESGEKENFDHIVYALGGTTPVNFLKLIGIEFENNEPVIADGFETNIKGLFLIGDLSAGNKGGSIIWAFNTAKKAIEKINLIV
ncbi:MAG TPA: NAD(P)-binding domain-containing protein [Ignavibacteriaceae bacterium]|nr:NAD(P)-binding domain-containing protein [Ignavibacteriaceae bacterium]